MSCRELRWVPNAHAGDGKGSAEGGISHLEFQPPWRDEGDFAAPWSHPSSRLRDPRLVSLPGAASLRFPRKDAVPVLKQKQWKVVVSPLARNPPPNTKVSCWALSPAQHPETFGHGVVGTWCPCAELATFPSTPRAATRPLAATCTQLSTMCSQPISSHRPRPPRAVPTCCATAADLSSTAAALPALLCICLCLLSLA